MKFYKRNPEVEHEFTLQGIVMDEDTVVCGEEFAPFADPHTFPGRPPKLIVVSFESLTDNQKLQVKGFADKQAARPPRHLGIIKSDMIHTPGESKFKISNVPDISKERKKKLAEAKAIKTPEVKGPEQNLDLGRIRYGRNGKTTEQEIIEEMMGDSLPELKKMYSPTKMVEVFPGVTEKNVSKILENFRDLDELSKAANAELRRSGMPPNYFGRVRARAIAEKKSYEDSK
jgi:hypothetical protein